MNIIKVPPEFPKYPIPCNPVAPVPAGGNIKFGISVGAALVTSLPTRSSSGLYDGGIDSNAGMLIGLSAFYDVARFGTGSTPFSYSVLSFGVVTDFIGRASFDWTGRCGTARCIGDGYLNEFNIIFEGKLTTPVAPLTTAHVYAGVSGALLMPTGQPTGPFGPSFEGTDTALAWRVGVGMDYQVAQNTWTGLKVGFRRTGSTEFATTLPGERFRIGSKQEVIFAFNLSTSLPFSVGACSATLCREQRFNTPCAVPVAAGDSGGAAPAAACPARSGRPMASISARAWAFAAAATPTWLSGTVGIGVVSAHRRRLGVGSRGRSRRRLIGRGLARAWSGRRDRFGWLDRWDRRLRHQRGVRLGRRCFC